jgi:hypothetical protein
MIIGGKILTARRRASVLAMALAAIVIVAPAPLSSSPEEPARQNKRLAVLNFSANNTTVEIARIVRNNVELTLFKSQSFDILERDQINLIMTERKLQAKECADEGCAAKIGEILEAPYIIIGSVDKLDGFTVTVKVVSVREKRVIFAEARDADTLGKVKDATGEATLKVAERLRELGAPPKRIAVAGKPVLFSGYASYLGPRGYLSDILGPGYGFAVRASVRDLFTRSFVLGLEPGFMNFSGNDNTTHHATMVPLYLFAGYAVDLPYRLTLVPAAGGGVSYDSLYLYNDVSRTGYSRQSRLQPFARGGLALSVTLLGSLGLEAGADYTAIFEEAGRISFASLYGGARVAF